MLTFDEIRIQAARQRMLLFNSITNWEPILRLLENSVNTGFTLCDMDAATIHVCNGNSLSASQVNLLALTLYHLGYVTLVSSTLYIDVYKPTAAGWLLAVDPRRRLVVEQPL
jgi:hypothetical protein